MKRLISTSLVLFMLIGTISFANESNTIKSRGLVAFDNDNDGVSEVVFDASDLTALDNKITEGKQMIIDSLNANTSGGVPDNATFEEIANEINAVGSINIVNLGFYCSGYVGEGQVYKRTYDIKEITNKYRKPRFWDSRIQ